MAASQQFRTEVALPPMEERTVAAALKRVLDNTPDKVALRDPDRTLTYRVMVEESLGIAGALIDLGVGRQGSVLMMLGNHTDFVEIWLALSLTARIEVPVNTAYRGPILAHVIRNSGARIMIVESAYLERLSEVADALAEISTIIVRGGMSDVSLPGHINVMPYEALRRRPVAIEDVKPWDIIAIMYTSGTTGPSKGALIPHAQAYGYASPAVWLGSSPEDVNLAVLPLFHIAAQWAGVYNAFIAGASAVVLPGFSASTFWDKAREYGCTRAGMLGTIAQFLFNQPPRPDDHTQPIKTVGMTPVIPELNAFKKRFGIEKVSTGYGSTEVSAVACARPGEALPGYAGFLRSDFEARIVDENDMDVPSGAVGELIVRSREPWSMTAGYINMPEATTKAWRNLWFHTGDLMRQAENGQLVFCDRNNDAIRRRGENISSFEVEREIDTHPAVLESAVIKTPSNHADDDVKACVVIRPGHTLAFEALLSHVEKRLPAFMVPRYIEFLDALPKTPTEKVLKVDLRKDSLNAKTWDSVTKGFVGA